MSANSNVIPLNAFRAPKQQKRKDGRKRKGSFYERYPMPFFNKNAHSTWNVTPTGDYGADCETGRAYAIAFLRSCDGSFGWASLLSSIVTDMIGAGPGGFWRTGGARSNGIVVGFTGTIGKALVGALADETFVERFVSALEQINRIAPPAK